MSRVPLSPDAINALIDLLEQRNIQEIELQEGQCRIRIVRALAPTPASHHASTPNAGTITQPAELRPTGNEPDAPGLLRSEMVGIVYLAPDPASEAFVRVGDKVEAGQTLLLIEAMKSFHKYTAPRAGTITRILVESGEMVDYGKGLMVLGE